MNIEELPEKNSQLLTEVKYAPGSVQKSIDQLPKLLVALVAIAGANTGSNIYIAVEGAANGKSNQQSIRSPIGNGIQRIAPDTRQNRAD